MILLDTNIVSAIMAPAPQRTVIDWLNSHETFTLYLSTITVAEIGYGLWVLPEGKRRRILDGQIAPIARASGFALATRNVRDFEDCGCDVINPFEAAE